jgi:hypothetical protein
MTIGAYASSLAYTQQQMTFTAKVWAWMLLHTIPVVLAPK